MRGEGRRTAAAFVAVVAVLAVVFVLGRGDSPSESPPDRALHSALPRAPQRPITGAAALPPHRNDLEGDAGALRGTAVDGALPVDAGGHLIAAPDVIRFFDHFFVDSGDVDDAVIRRRIEAAIDARLDEPARGEARRLLERYLDYRAAAARLFAEGGAGDALGERVEAIAELRREAFGDEVDPLFGSELEHARIAAEMRAAAADPNLSAESRAARIDELDAQLPADVRAARERATAPLALARDEAALRAAGGGDAEIRTLREERFGTAAADRLAALDRERAEWRVRVDEFRRHRSAIEADEALPPEQRAARVEELLASDFSAAERQRLMALDRIELDR